MKDTLVEKVAIEIASWGMLPLREATKEREWKLHYSPRIKKGYRNRAKIIIALIDKDRKYDLIERIRKARELFFDNGGEACLSDFDRILPEGIDKERENEKNV